MIDESIKVCKWKKSDISRRITVLQGVIYRCLIVYDLISTVLSIISKDNSFQIVVRSYWQSYNYCNVISKNRFPCLKNSWIFEVQISKMGWGQGNTKLSTRLSLFTKVP